MNLDGAVCIVTGASGGIGGAIAVALAGEGGRMVLTGRRADRLAAVVEEVARPGDAVVVVDGDIGSAATCAAVVETALSRFGRVDVLVNAAGYGPPANLVDLTEEVWDATLDSCLKGSYLMTRAALPVMLEAGSGRVVIVSSVAGKAVEGRRTAYCAAEWGLQGFALALQDELASTDIRVHVVNPANVATNWWDTTDDPQPPEVMERMLTSEDVAETVVWMLTRPDHVHVNDVIVHNARNPWGS